MNEVRILASINDPNIVAYKEAFLDGHNSQISCLAISHDGTRIASGQSNIIGVKVKNH